METPIINIPITSKYKEVIEGVREYVREGMSHEEAVSVAFREFKYKFESDEEEAILLSWLDGSLAA